MSNHHHQPDPTKPVVISNPASGPKSDIGRAISSRNAIRHGCCCADTLILKDRENIEDYQALEATWFKVFSPKDDAEIHLVQELVNSDWFHQRSTRTVAEVEAQIFEAEPNPLHWTEQQHRSLARFLRYQTTRANAVKRCRKAVEDYRKNRTTEQRNEEKQVIVRERHAIYKEKNKPAPTFEETIDLMRKKAIALGYAVPDPPKTK